MEKMAMGHIPTPGKRPKTIKQEQEQRKQPSNNVSQQAKSIYSDLTNGNINIKIKPTKIEPVSCEPNYNENEGKILV